MKKNKRNHGSKHKNRDGLPHSERGGGGGAHPGTPTTQQYIDRTREKLPTKRKRLRQEVKAAIQPPDQYQLDRSVPDTPPNELRPRARRADVSLAIRKGDKRGKAKSISSLEGD